MAFTEFSKPLIGNWILNQHITLGGQTNDSVYSNKVIKINLQTVAGQNALAVKYYANNLLIYDTTIAFYKGSLYYSADSTWLTETNLLYFSGWSKSVYQFKTGSGTWQQLAAPSSDKYYLAGFRKIADGPILSIHPPNNKKENILASNPVSDGLTFTHTSSIKYAEVFDLSGRMLISSQIGNNQFLNVKMLPRGVYVLKALDFNQNIFHLTFVKF